MSRLILLCIFLASLSSATAQESVRSRVAEELQSLARTCREIANVVKATNCAEEAERLRQRWETLVSTGYDLDEAVGFTVDEVERIKRDYSSDPDPMITIPDR